MDVFSLVLVSVLTISCGLLIGIIGYSKLNKISMSLKLSKLSKFNPISVYNCRHARIISNKQIISSLQAMKQRLTDKKNGVTESQMTKVSRMMAAKSDSNAAIMNDSLSEEMEDVQIFSLDSGLRSQQYAEALSAKEVEMQPMQTTVLDMNHQPSAMMKPMEETDGVVKPFTLTVSQQHSQL